MRFKNELRKAVLLLCVLHKIDTKVSIDPFLNDAWKLGMAAFCVVVGGLVTGLQLHVLKQSSNQSQPAANGATSPVLLGVALPSCCQGYQPLGLGAPFLCWPEKNQAQEASFSHFPSLSKTKAAIRMKKLAGCLLCAPLHPPHLREVKKWFPAHSSLRIIYTFPSTLVSSSHVTLIGDSLGV